jgi:hypothetical protein
VRVVTLSECYITGVAGLAVGWLDYAGRPAIRTPIASCDGPTSRDRHMNAACNKDIHRLWDDLADFAVDQPAQAATMIHPWAGNDSRSVPATAPAPCTLS